MTKLYDGMHHSDNYIAMMQLAWAQAYAEDVQRRKNILHGWKYRQQDYTFPRTCKDAFGAYICDVERHICDVERHVFFWRHE